MNWRRLAACRGMPTDLFFPYSGEQEEARRARAVCAACPVSNECLWESLEFIEPHGIFGGTTVTQRRAIRRAYGIDSYRKPEAEHGTESRYRHHKCRCDACVKANYWAQMKRNERQARPLSA